MQILKKIAKVTSSFVALALLVCCIPKANAASVHAIAVQPWQCGPQASTNLVRNYCWQAGPGNTVYLLYANAPSGLAQTNFAGYSITNPPIGTGPGSVITIAVAAQGASADSTGLFDDLCMTVFSNYDTGGQIWFSLANLPYTKVTTCAGEFRIITVNMNTIFPWPPNTTITRLLVYNIGRASGLDPIPNTQMIFGQIQLLPAQGPGLLLYPVTEECD
jgi:hypothetical protein